MKPTHARIIVEHELPDGRILTCEYTKTTIRGNLSGSHDDSYPDEHDYSDPEYTLDGEHFEQDDLPIELTEVAVSMYVDTYRYKYREEAIHEDV